MIHKVLSGAILLVGMLASPFSEYPGQLGMYSWSQSYWTSNNPELLTFFSHEVGNQWIRGDVMFNVADWSCSGEISKGAELVKLMKAYRVASGNYDNVFYLTYGDVTNRDTDSMMNFVDTFFTWVSTIRSKDRPLIGKFGISFDVEKLPPRDVERVLVKCQILRSAAGFTREQLLIQHTLDDEPSPDVTDVVMKYADSALAMTYSNYLEASDHSDDADFTSDHSFEGRIRWLLTKQCQKCLDSAYVSANYNARLTLMVEASCEMGKSGKFKTFCVNDTDGASYMASVLIGGLESVKSSGLMSSSQFDQLFNHQTTFVVHNFEWFRCFPPFETIATFPSCKRFHQLAEARRSY